MHKPPQSQLDSYSLMIVSKYFITQDDYINMVCTNSKHKCTLDKFHFNPIPILNKKLFPNIQTQHLYNSNDIKLDEIDQYVIWYPVSITQSMSDKKIYKNIILEEEDIPLFFTYLPSNYNTKIYSSPDNLVLPTTIKGIGCNCFKSVTKLTSITIPSNVSFIDNEAFYNQTSLQTITIPNGVTRLGNKCFGNCEALRIQQLPSTIVSIGSYCFWDTNVNFSTLPLSLTCLCEGCFMYNNPIQSLTLPTNLNRIEDSCFFGCSLTSIKLPNSLTHIGKRCFKQCEYLKSITIPSLITILPLACFEDCCSLTRVNLSTNLQNIEEYCFSKCKELYSIDIPTTVTSIGDDSFYLSKAMSCIPNHLKLNEATIKILLVGMSKSGKESLQKRYTKNYFAEEYNPTLVPNYSKRITFEKFRISVQTEAFSTNIEEYFGGDIERVIYSDIMQSDCFFITFSICDRESFDDVSKTLNSLKSVIMDEYEDQRLPPIFLVGCKSDLSANRVISNEEALIKAKELNVEYYETSSLTGENVDLVFGHAIEIIMSRRDEPKKERKRKLKRHYKHLKNKHECEIV